MEIGTVYEIDHCVTTDAPPIYSVKLPSSLIASLQQQSFHPENNEYILFTSPTQGHIAIDGKEFSFKAIRETNKECYILEENDASSSELLRWVGNIDSKLILQNAISDLFEFVPETASPVRKSKRLSSASRRIHDIAAPSRQDSGANPSHDTFQLPEATDTSKPRKRRRPEESSRDVGGGGEVGKSPHPTHHLKWLVIRSAPPHTSRGDIAALMEGIRLKSLFVCSAENHSDFDVYLEFESLEGAELGLMRSGEPLANTAAMWVVEPVQRPEAVWAKALGVRLTGKTKVLAAYDACMSLFPEELKGLRPGALRQRLQPVCKNALSPEQVSDTFYGLGSKMFSPIESLLYAHPNPFTSSSLNVHPGHNEDDTTTPYIAGQIGRLIRVWSSAYLSQNHAALDVSSRMLSAFQLAYELSWRRFSTLTTTIT